MERRHTAAIVFLFLLALTCIGLRLPATAPEAPPHQTAVCISIAYENRILGVVTAAPTQVAFTAALRLGLPEECRVPSSEAARAVSGETWWFADADGNCQRIRQGAMSASARLLCGLKLDVNRAEAGDLELIPGIGPVKASRIVEARQRNGPFTSSDDLTAVPGIGPKTAERFAAWLLFRKDSD